MECSGFMRGNKFYCVCLFNYPFLASLQFLTFYLFIYLFVCFAAASSLLKKKKSPPNSVLYISIFHLQTLHDVTLFTDTNAKYFNLHNYFVRSNFFAQFALYVRLPTK